MGVGSECLLTISCWCWWWRWWWHLLWSALTHYGAYDPSDYCAYDRPILLLSLRHSRRRPPLHSRRPRLLWSRRW